MCRLCSVWNITSITDAARTKSKIRLRIVPRTPQFRSLSEKMHEVKVDNYSYNGLSQKFFKVNPNSRKYTTLSVIQALNLSFACSRRHHIRNWIDQYAQNWKKYRRNARLVRHGSLSLLVFAYPCPQTRLRLTKRLKLT